MSIGRMIAFFLVVGGLSAALHYYVWARVVRDAAIPMPWARVATIAIIAFAVLVPLALPLTRALPRNALVPVMFVVYTWMGLLFLLFFTNVGGDLVRLGLALAGRASSSDTAVDPERRAFVTRTIAIVSGVIALGAGVWALVEAQTPVAVRKVKVALRKLPVSMRGTTLVQLSDVHVGPTIGRGFIESIVAKVNALDPDAVVITGDLVDGSVEELREHIAPLAKLRAKHGVFFVTGNHEYYSGADEWIAELRRLGVRVLRNERVELREGDAAIDLAGVDDWSAHQFGHGHGADLARALEGRDDGRELILLAHQPRAIEEASQRGVGLVLSGHTHGGQIFPWNFLVRLQQPYVAGLHRHGDAQIYVSRGTGYWGPPMRLGAPAEITQLTLEPATA